MPENRETCFVIMPFSQTTEKHTEEYWNGHFTICLKPFIEENPRLEACRSEALRGDILRQIITNLALARVVVADLTDNNPNVYWELGIRQSYKHCTVTIAEFGTKVPFDISSKGTLWYYPNDHLKMQDFRERLKQATKDCLVNPDSPDSHVLEILGGRGTLFEVFHKDEAIRRLDALISEGNRNIGLFNTTMAQANINLDYDKSKSKAAEPKSSERQSFATYLGSSALDLLVVERYVQEGEQFYVDLQGIRSWHDWFNHLVREWPTRRGSVDQLFISNEKEARKNLEACIILAQKARKKVSSLL